MRKLVIAMICAAAFALPSPAQAFTFTDAFVAACLAGLAIPLASEEIKPAGLNLLGNNQGNFNGAFLGLSLGRNDTAIKGGLNETGLFSLNLPLSATGAEEGITAGYRRTYGNLMLGLELEAMLSQADSGEASFSEGGVSGSAKAQKRYGFTLGPRVGYQITNDSLAFVGIDWARARFRTTLTDNTGSSDIDDWQNGLRFGGGVEVALSQDLNLRLDYQHTDWNSWRWWGAWGSASLKAHEDAVRVTAIYPFR